MGLIMAKNIIKSVVKDFLFDVSVSLKESTCSTYYTQIHNHIIPYFQHISDIDNTTIKKFTKEKLENGRLDKKSGLSAKMVCALTILLVQLIQYGQKQGCINKFEIDVVLPQISEKPLEILNLDEQNRLVRYLYFNLDVSNIGVLIALYTGIRIGELCALKWQDIDLESETIKITKTIQRIKNTDKKAETKTKVVIDTPKSKKSVRNIPIPDFLLKILKTYQNIPDIYVLSGKTKYIEPRTYQNRFEKYLEKAKVERIPFHALRHTFATRSIESGMDIKTLSELLGHSSVKFTLDRYVHSSFELKKLSINKLPFCC